MTFPGALLSIQNLLFAACRTNSEGRPQSACPRGAGAVPSSLGGTATIRSCQAAARVFNPNAGDDADSSVHRQVVRQSASATLASRAIAATHSAAPVRLAARTIDRAVDS